MHTTDPHDAGTAVDPATLPSFIALNFRDWEGIRHAELSDVPTDATVGEVLDEARRAMGLPLDVSFQALLDERELNHLDTLADAGVAADAQIELIPHTQAGGASPAR